MPDVVTDYPQNIGQFTFKLMGFVESMGGYSSLKCWFIWCKTSDKGNSSNWNIKYVTYRYTSGSYSSTISSGIQSGTNYSVAAYVTDANNVLLKTGQWVDFSTLASTGNPPIVSTVPIYNKGTTGVDWFKAWGLVFFQDADSIYGYIDYRKKGSSTWIEISEGELTKGPAPWYSAEWYIQPENLDQNSTYEYRAVIEYLMGGTWSFAYGDVEEAILEDAPEVVTTDYLYATEDGFSLDGTITYLGSYSEIWYAWEIRKTGESIWSVTSRFGPTSTEGDVPAVTIIGLDSSTQYDYRFGAWSSTAVGDNVAYGNTKIVTTLAPEDPTVVTWEPFPNDTFTILRGQITTMGGLAEVKYYYRFIRTSDNAEWIFGPWNYTSANAVAPTRLGVSLASGSEFKYRSEIYTTADVLLDTGDYKFFSPTSAILNPEIVSLSAENIESTSADLLSRMDSLGNFGTVYYRVYLKNKDNNDIFFSQYVGPWDELYNVTTNWSSLANNTNYEFESRLYENN